MRSIYVGNPARQEKSLRRFPEGPGKNHDGANPNRNRKTICRSGYVAETCLLLFAKHDRRKASLSHTRTHTHTPAVQGQFGAQEQVDLGLEPSVQVRVRSRGENRKRGPSPHRQNGTPRQKGEGQPTGTSPAKIQHERQLTCAGLVQQPSRSSVRDTSAQQSPEI